MSPVSVYFLVGPNVVAWGGSFGNARDVGAAKRRALFRSGRAHGSLLPKAFGFKPRTNGYEFAGNTVGFCRC